MKRKLTIRRTVCSIVAALLAAAAVWLLCRWVGYDLQLRVGDTQTFAILNDDYSQVIDVTGEGLTQSMPVSAGQTVYGVRLDFSTQGTPRQSGMLMVDLYDSTGTLRGQAAGDYLNIFDNLFTAFAFDSTYTPAQDETMTLHIYSVAAWDGPLGLWASTGTVDGMPLLVGDTDAGATLALQMMTDNAAQWPTTLANQLAPVLAAAAFAAVLLFGLQTPLALTVAVVGLACGLAFVQVTPALVAPDEYFHLAAAYELASRIGGQTPADEDGNLLVRECDAPHFGTRSGEIGILPYKNQEMARRNEAGGPDELTVASEAKAGQGSSGYLAQALGVRLARSLGQNFYTMLRTGRIFNLISYLALAALAVALAPAGVRGLLACVALLPMPLELAASFSPDTPVLGTIFCYTALCLRLRSKKAVWWEKLLLVALGGLVGPAKAIYLPVVLLCFIIPVENLDGGRGAVKGPFGLRVQNGWYIQGAVLVLASCLWIFANLSELAYAARDMNHTMLAVGGVALAVLLVLALWLYAVTRGDAKKRRAFRWGLAVVVVLAAAGSVYALTHMGGGLNPDQLLMVKPNGDSLYTFSLGYVFRNLPATAKLLLRSIPEQGAFWLQGMLGTTLGEPIVYRIDVSWLLGIGLVLALLAAAFPAQGEQPPLGRRTAWGTVAILFGVAAALVVVVLNWTPINYQTLFGMQGRYWLPVLPLALLLCKRSRCVALRHDASRGAALAVTACTLLTLLQGFSLYASWQQVS